jgi:hypothetical protein
MKNPQTHDQNHGKIHTNALIPHGIFRGAQPRGPFSNQVQQALAAQRERRGLKAAKDAQVRSGFFDALGEGSCLERYLIHIIHIYIYNILIFIY